MGSGLHFPWFFSFDRDGSVTKRFWPLDCITLPAFSPVLQLQDSGFGFRFREERTGSPMSHDEQQDALDDMMTLESAAKRWPQLFTAIGFRRAARAAQFQHIHKGRKRYGTRIDDVASPRGRDTQRAAHFGMHKKPRRIVIAQQHHRFCVATIGPPIRGRNGRETGPPSH